MTMELSMPARLRGVVEVPGDKSISHRSVMLNAVAEGNAVITNYLTGADCLSTIACMQVLGVEVEREGTTVRVRGAVLHGGEYTLPVASAQVKSALLLAALIGDGVLRLTGKIASRDHTER